MKVLKNIHSLDPQQFEHEFKINIKKSANLINDNRKIKIAFLSFPRLI